MRGFLLISGFLTLLILGLDSGADHANVIIGEVAANGEVNLMRDNEAGGELVDAAEDGLATHTDDSGEGVSESDRLNAKWDEDEKQRWTKWFKLFNTMVGYEHFVKTSVFMRLQYQFTKYDKNKDNLLDQDELWKYHAETRYMRKGRYKINPDGSSGRLNKNGSLPLTPEESGLIQAKVESAMYRCAGKVKEYRIPKPARSSLRGNPVECCDGFHGKALGFDDFVFCSGRVQNDFVAHAMVSSVCKDASRHVTVECARKALKKFGGALFDWSADGLGALVGPGTDYPIEYLSNSSKFTASPEWPDGSGLTDAEITDLLTLNNKFRYYPQLQNKTKEYLYPFAFNLIHKKLDALVWFRNFDAGNKGFLEEEEVKQLANILPVYKNKHIKKNTFPKLRNEVPMRVQLAAATLLESPLSSFPRLLLLNIYASEAVWLEGYLPKSSPHGLAPFTSHPKFPPTCGYESRTLDKLMSHVTSKKPPKCGDKIID